MSQQQYEIRKPSNYEILLISFPHQLLYALSALHYNRINNRVSVDSPAVIFVWSYKGVNHKSKSIYHDIFSAVLQTYPYIELVFPTFLERSYYLSPYRSISARVKWVQKRFLGHNFNEVYFSHDASADRTAQVIMQTFRTAKSICYGDPPGFIHPPYNKHRLQCHSESKLKRWFWKFKHETQQLDERFASKAFVAVDMQSKDKTSISIKVTPIPLKYLKHTHSLIGRAFEKSIKKTYVEMNINFGDLDNPYLLLMGNFSGSGLMSEENELDMYVDICNRHVPMGGGLFLKPHPGNSLDFVNKVIDKLPQFQTQALPLIALQIPIEIMSDLINYCHIVSVSSSSIPISIFYQGNLIHALNDELIYRYFNMSSLNHMLDANFQIISKVNIEHIKHDT